MISSVSFMLTSSTGGIGRPDHLDESIFNFRSFCECVLFCCSSHRNSCKASNVDSDQTTHFAASELGLH